jgi:2,4-didehydro-3-deoxy-L-rhamnonate hydrolase
MKLLRYIKNKEIKPGLIDDKGEIRDLSAVIDDISSDTLSEENLLKLKGLNLDSLPLVDKSVPLAPCVGEVGKFICVGLNFADHAAEAGMSIPEEPVLFFKATSAISGPNDNIIMPRNGSKLDWEVELGIVIGEAGVYINEDEAEQHIAGYCMINDVSERRFQMEISGGQWDKGKGCDTFGPIGPWLVTKDEIEDIDNLDMWLEVNGKRYQDGNTKTMIFRTNFLVSYISQFMSLQAGDIISTGTPPGVGFGMDPQVYLKPDDVITLGIENMGVQRQQVVTPI